MTRFRFHKKYKYLRCYICFIVWLGLLLLLLSYWRTEHSETLYPSPKLSRGDEDGASGQSIQDKPRLKKLRQLCNTPDRIHTVTEGCVPLLNYELVGVTITTRHGDRGPMIPVRNLSSINCSHKATYSSTYKQYVSSILNVSKTSDYTNFAHSFLKFPVLPSLHRCNVAQLTPQGIIQHLKLGKIMKETYISQLDLLKYPWEADDIVIHSTKFRRTYQSALAFLYAFLPKFDISQMKMLEGQGLSYCNNNCHCDLVSVLDEKYNQERKSFRSSHPGVLELIEKLSAVVKDGPGTPDILNPVAMRDALMTYTCHGHKLPCVDGVCVQPEDVSSIISYEEWESKQKKSRAKNKAAKLRAYGMLKNIANYLDTMMRDGKPKFVLFSAHDKTLNYLLTSLGVPVYQVPHYASRLNVEVYKNLTSNSPTEYRQNFYFRMVYNGKDITKFLHFCEVKSVGQHTATSGLKTSVSLCPVTSFDNYVRAANYFKEFNATNFRQACVFKNETKKITKLTTEAKPKQ